jgi:simple sugar transport system permease protein
MTWADILNLGFLTTIVAASIRVATPILLAALGETISESAGVLNIGIEGMMAVGAFVGFAGAYWTGNAWAGFASAMVAGTLVGLLSGIVVVEFNADQVVTGIVMNIFCAGIAGLAYRILFGDTSSIPSVPVLRSFAIPWLSQLPVIGRAFFNHAPIVYASVALVPICWFLLRRTKWGLNIRAAGENPAAAESVSINVWRVRLMAIAAGGAFAGLGGATLSIAQVGGYLDDMTAGRGFIALAIVVFGGLNPWWAAVGALVFGFAEALELRLQAMGAQVPYELLLGLPYILTIIVLTVWGRRATYPAAINQPYPRRRVHRWRSGAVGEVAQLAA